MRVLIISDSHGSVYNLRQILTIHDDIDTVIFLGDGERDFSSVTEELGGRKLIMVCGNCDLGSDLETVRLERFENNLVMICHGHTYRVKYGNEYLLEEAGRLGANLVLYGHTHEQETDYVNGMYVMNPGALLNYQYGIADITRSGIVLTKMDMLKR